jgi:hypothetical protein
MVRYSGLVILGFIAATNAACNPHNVQFKMASESHDFAQADAKLNNQIDVLWVVDNSGSMDPLQKNLVANFSSFMNDFVSRGFDYQMAVTTSDAFRSDPRFKNQPELAKFSQGKDISGFPIVSPSVMNPLDVFLKNVAIGNTGAGDERVFQSMFAALKSPFNAGFMRPGAYFAVIILSDEDDFSDENRPENSWETKGGIADHAYNSPGLTKIDDVVAELDAMTNSTENNRHYNVSAITVGDEQCWQQHLKETSTTIIGKRYIELAERTKGVVGSICDPSYADTLSFIKERIVELVTQFKLAETPSNGSLSVTVNGELVPQDSSNGWTYQKETNSITFHGRAVPPVAAAIRVSFDPTHL